MDEVETICEEIAGQGHFLEERGIAEWPDGTISGRYAFRHALYQNVLYERIAEARRVRLHRLIGEREEQAYHARAGEIAAELAVHFERGHDYHRAVQYYEQAGKNAIRRSAHVEAISLLTKGLELLKTLPDTLDRTQQELSLQVALGVSLLMIKGQSAPDVGATYARARELCQQLGNSPQVFPILFGLYRFYLARGEHQTALELADQLLPLAQQTQDLALLLGARYALASTLFYRGEFAFAREQFEQGITLYDSQYHRSLALHYGHDLGVSLLCFGAWTLWHLGYPDQALKTIQEALTLARELGHPFSLAYALTWAAFIPLLRREGQVAQARAEALSTLANEQGFAFLLTAGTINRGWALAEQGRAEEGIVHIQQGLTAARAMGARSVIPYFLSSLAEAYGKVGQVEEGLTVLAEALDLVNATGERFYEAELYRLKGELTVQQFNVQGSKFKVEKSPRSKVQSPKLKNTDPRPPTPDPQGEAEACFLKAIEIARHQQAKSLELRAATSLARLWQQQGKKEEAHEMLAAIYGWFTEGFDTKDLQEAKTLLEELSH
jgi:predicted ATPase